jgi:hypothetical protein
VLCWQYSSITGALTSHGEPLSNRGVKLYIDGSQVSEASTDINGNYQTAIGIPYKYVNSITIQVIYLPTGSDKNEYLAALSPTITIKVLFLTTNLQISASDVAYPVTIYNNGKVMDAEGHGLTDRQITVTLDDNKQTQLKTDQDGTFTTKFTINTQTTLGKHTLTASVDAQNLYAPTSKQKTITVQKMATTLEVEAPTFMVLQHSSHNWKSHVIIGPLKGAQYK